MRCFWLSGKNILSYSKWLKNKDFCIINSNLKRWWTNLWWLNTAPTGHTLRSPFLTAIERASRRSCSWITYTDRLFLKYRQTICVILSLISHYNIISFIDHTLFVRVDVVCGKNEAKAKTCSLKTIYEYIESITIYWRQYMMTSAKE